MYYSIPSRHLPGIFIVKFEHISHLNLLFLLLTLNMQLPAGYRETRKAHFHAFCGILISLI